MTTAEVWIPLSRGKVTVIDFEDFEKVRPYKWHAFNGGKGNEFYAGRKSSRTLGPAKTIILHRFIFGEENIPPGFEIAHKDGDGLNNRRSTNLQCLTHAQNLHGKQRKRPNATSPFRGVCWVKARNTWQAAITLAGQSIFLGYFELEIDAVKAYDVAARKHYGEHAALNFPKEVQNAE